MHRSVLPVLSVLLFLYVSVAWASDLKTYVNQRFGFSIAYPPGLLLPQGESANGDGQKFISPDGQATLIACASYNALEQDLNELFNQATIRDGRRTTYRRKKTNWFVVSGYEPDGRIFFQKTIQNADILYSYEFVYPQTQKHIFDPLTGSIGTFFRVPK